MKTERLITNRKIQFSFIKAFPFYLVEINSKESGKKKKYEILNDIVAQNSNLDSIKNRLPH
jgi:hypothetical protein